MLQEYPELFLIRAVTDIDNNADLRWTVDVAEDLEMVRCLYEQLDLARRPLGYRQILQHVRAHPDLAAMNAAVVQKA